MRPALHCILIVGEPRGSCKDLLCTLLQLGHLCVLPMGRTASRGCFEQAGCTCCSLHWMTVAMMGLKQFLLCPQHDMPGCPVEHCVDASSLCLGQGNVLVGAERPIQ